MVSIAQMNLFPSVPPTHNPFERRTQIISTRIFIIMLITSLCILLSYISVRNIMKVVIEPKPTLERYELLNAQYWQTLVCPCKAMTIDYEKMLRIEYKLHPLCSSGFVDDDWIHYVAEDDGSLVDIHNFNFKSSGPFMFQGLAFLCRLVRENIDFSLQQFYSTKFMSLNLLPLDYMETQMSVHVKNLELSTIGEFLSFLETVSEIIQVNTLLSVTGSNAAAMSSFGAVYQVEFKSYSNCSCFLRRDCVASMRIIRNNGEVNTEVPGMYVGCYILEALLQSDFRCFFDESCFDTLIFHLDRGFSPNARVLNASALLRFYPNSTVRDILDKLMLEEWRMVTLYETYFNTCQPIECKYSFQTRNDLIYIVTTLFGLVGGISTVLKLIVPRLISSIRKKMFQTNAPTVQSRGMSYKMLKSNEI